MPGPGNYNVVETPGKDAPKFSFGKEIRADKGRPMTPGPGTYQIKTFVGKDAPRITMSPRPQSSTSERNFVPGPGTYSAIYSNRPKSPSYGLGTSKRDAALYRTLDHPGPGAYSPVNNTSIRPKSPTWSMGIGKRDNLNPTQSVPGPGNYNVSKGLGNGPKVK